MKKKNVWVQFRTDNEIKEEIKQAAKMQGLSISDFLRQVVCDLKKSHNLAA